MTSFSLSFRLHRELFFFSLFWKFCSRQECPFVNFSLCIYLLLRKDECAGSGQEGGHQAGVNVIEANLFDRIIIGDRFEPF